MTRTNLRHLFKNKGNFIYNHKLKELGHMSETVDKKGLMEACP